MASDENKEQMISIEDILYIVLKHYKLIVSFMVIGFVAGIIVSFALYIKGVTKVNYNISASIAVTSVNEDGLFGGNKNSNPDATDIHLAEDMTEAVIYVCKSDATLEEAAEKLELIGVKAEDIKPKLSLTQYKETQIIEMNLVWNNAEEGIMILEAINDVVPEILINSLKIGDVTLVNKPKVKKSTLSFINKKIILLATLGGAIVVAMFLLVKHFIKPTILHPEEVKNMYNLEILGKIPTDPIYFDMKVNSLPQGSFFAVKEAFLSTAHVIEYGVREMNSVCFYVTSSEMMEGKSSIVANLGSALAEHGYGVLLIDMDFGNPSLASKFSITSNIDYDLFNVYRGEAMLIDAVVPISNNLHILPTRYENKKMMIDRNFKEIIDQAKAMYNFVIIDTAPIGQVSDALGLNRVVDGAVFVIRQDLVSIANITDCINSLRKSGVMLFGAIVNDLKDKKSAYYNYGQEDRELYKYLKERTKKDRKHFSRKGRFVDKINKKKNKHPNGKGKNKKLNNANEANNSEPVNSSADMANSVDNATVNLAVDATNSVSVNPTDVGNGDTGEVHDISDAKHI